MTKSKAQLVWRFPQDVQKKEGMFMIIENVGDKLLKFMYISIVRESPYIDPIF